MSSSLDIEIQEKIELGVQNAIDMTGFGKFNAKVVSMCSLICMNTAFVLGNFGFILPSAACDFRMSSANKGLLSAVPIIGMVCGAYFWGCHANIKGRKNALSASLLLQGSTEFVSCFIPNYGCFVFLKFFTGFALTCQIGLIYSYLAEFQPNQYRSMLMIGMEGAWTMGLIFLPLIAWLIIPLKIHYEQDYFFFHSWNLFVLICSLPSLLIGISMLFFYETPKFLARMGQGKELLELLGTMYTQNTGKPAEQYFEELIKSKNHICKLLKLVEDDNDKNEQQNVQVTQDSIKSVLRSTFVQTMLLFKSPYLATTLSLAVITFGVMTSYYTLMLWFPELFHRFAKFELQYPGESANVCKISVNFHANDTNETFLYDCQGIAKTDVYYHTIYLGLSCLPMSILIPLIIRYISYKICLVTLTLLSSATVFSFFLISSSTDNLILSCFFEALASMCMGLVLCIITEIYPTNLRVIAASLVSIIARLGALTGLFLIGYLIDNYCVLFIIIIGVELFVSMVFSLFIPLENKVK